MVEFAITLPVVRGKQDSLKYLSGLLSDRKRKEFQVSRQRLGINREIWFFESSMRGDTLIIYQEGEGAQKSFVAWVESQDPFDVWLKDQMKEITGIDFAPPAPESTPSPLLKYPF